MDERLDDTLPEEEHEHYVPRPWWQVWGARIVLVLFLALVAAYYVKIARGGL